MNENIFISYRHDDEPGFTQALYRELRSQFSRATLFMDVAGGIGAGEDLRAVVEDRVQKCEVLLAVMGPRWLNAEGQGGHRRLDGEDDLARIEIASALKGNKRVIPVLVNGARVPLPDELPVDLKPLSWRRAITLRHERFGDDCAALIGELRAALENAHRAQTEPYATLVDPVDVMGREIRQLRAVVAARTRQRTWLILLAVIVATAGLAVTPLACEGLLAPILGLVRTP
jgi:TIR domain